MQGVYKGRKEKKAWMSEREREAEGVEESLRGLSEGWKATRQSVMERGEGMEVKV